MAESWTVTGTDGGFTVGDLVYKSGTSTFTAAQADSASTLADGIVTAVVAATSYTVFVGVGVCEITAHGLGSAGDEGFTSTSSAGDSTTTPPSGGVIRQKVFQVLDDDNLLFRAEWGAWAQ